MPRPLAIPPSFALGLAAALALGLAACTPSPRPGSLPQTSVPENRPQPAQPPGGPGAADVHGRVNVALLVPLSGAEAGAVDAGNAIANAARMAATDLGDPALELSVHDTGGTPEGARAAAQTAVGEGAALILGPLFGPNTGAVGEVALRAGVQVISFSNDSSVAGGPVFVSGFLPEAEAARVVGFAAARGHDRLAVFYPDTGYGHAALRGAERAARVVAASGYPRSFQGIQDASGSFAGAARAAGANAVLLPDSGQGLRSAAAFLDYGGLDPARVRFLGLGQWHNEGTLQEATLRGGWFAAPDPERFETFARLYSARHGARPPQVAVLGYDAVQAAGQLLTEARQAGSRNPFGRAELTRAQGFRGALGPFRFDADGSSHRAMAILEVGEGGFAVIDPAPSRIDLLF
ncbi:MAG TPA: penicillin-binding protein activator [Thermohalobaculum sp.]|nr:penicillin-binding protein activator [Thermohalobaculum sp.]